MLLSLFSARKADGRSHPAVQPVAGSVTGSPFTVPELSSVETPKLSGMVLIHTDQAIHVRFSKDGQAATTNNMVLPAGQLHQIPVDGDILSMIAAPSDGGLRPATVHVELARMV